MEVLLLVWDQAQTIAVIRICPLGTVNVGTKLDDLGNVENVEKSLQRCLYFCVLPVCRSVYQDNVFL